MFKIPKTEKKELKTICVKWCFDMHRLAQQFERLCLEHCLTCVLSACLSLHVCIALHSMDRSQNSIENLFKYIKLL